MRVWVPGLGVARAIVDALDRVAGTASHGAEPQAPPYVEYGPLMALPAPYAFEGVTLDGFWADADPAKLTALCDKVFQRPSGGAIHCRPLGRRVMLTWGYIERAIATTPPYDQRGAVAEPQVAIWVPCALRERFAMFVPYIWLDNPMSLASGRELFGYPKAWGWPELPSGDGSRAWKLDVFGLDYGPDQRAARHPLLEIVEQGSALRGAEAELGSIADLARDMVAALDLTLAADISEDVLREVVPQAFLKQFRTVQDGVDAALQQVVQAEYTVKRLKASALLHEHELTVHRLDSNPLIDELGLESQTLGPAYHVEMDFTLGRGRILWP